MNIGPIDKFKVLMRALQQVSRLPSLKQKLAYLLCPVDSVRYTEFGYLFKAMRNYRIEPHQVLDVSSPFVLAYMLSGGARVIKTDINPAEAKNICKSDKLFFQLEDATRLSFEDASFDFVYSISVIEHIYERYSDAVKEMVRVLRPGGYLYLTFPVADRHVEEWLEETIYSHQHATDGKVFFQYRFSEQDVIALLGQLSDVGLMDMSVYWERRDGDCDRTMDLLRRRVGGKLIHEFRKALINFRAGFALLENQPSGFSTARSLGVASLLLRKGVH